MTNVRKPKPAASPSPAEEVSSTIDVLGGNARSRLLSFVERIERLAEEAQITADDLKETYAEIKGEGFDVKILRKVIRLRKMDKAKRQEEEALIDLYESAINGTEQPFIREIQPGDTVDDDPDEDEED